MSLLVALVCMAFLPVILASFCVGDAAAAAMKTGRVTGCVQGENVDYYRGVASLWNATEGRIPDPRQFIIIPSSVATLKPDGCFEIIAPAGDYYVGALVRHSPGAAMGPPRKGDVVFMTPGIDGGTVKVNVKPDEVVDVGTHNDSWRYEGLTAGLEMGVAGQVLDTENLPVEGLLVFAFADPEMSGSPLVVSERTSQDGAFQLRIDRPGRVFLRVKEAYGGGAPEAGGYVGVYGGGSPLPVSIEQDEVIRDVFIKVLRVPKEMTGARRLNKKTRELDVER